MVNLSYLLVVQTHSRMALSEKDVVIEILHNKLSVLEGRKHCIQPQTEPDSAFSGSRDESKSHSPTNLSDQHQETELNMSIKQNPVAVFPVSTTHSGRSSNSSSSPVAASFSKLSFPDGFATEPSTGGQNYPHMDTADSSVFYQSHSIYKPNGLGSMESLHSTGTTGSQNKPSVPTDMTNFAHLTNKTPYTELYSIDRVMTMEDHAAMTHSDEPLSSAFPPEQQNNPVTPKEHLMPLLLKKTPHESNETPISANEFHDLAQSTAKKDDGRVMRSAWGLGGPVPSDAFEMARNPGFSLFQPPFRDYSRQDSGDLAVHHMSNNAPYACHRPPNIQSPGNRVFTADRSMPPTGLGRGDEAVEFDGAAFDAYAKLPGLVRMNPTDSTMMPTGHPAGLCHREAPVVDPSIMVPFQQPSLFAPPTAMPNPYLSCSPFPKSDADDAEIPGPLSSAPWTGAPGGLGFGQNTGQSMELNTARRRNATRESTNTLKKWLQEHINNPYPTKGEKIMLAIITKMTLTQVSTWFANARRRLKKENKMTWTPKHRGEEVNEDGSEDELGSEDDQGTNNDDNELTDTESPSTQEKPSKRYCMGPNENYQQQQQHPTPKMIYPGVREYKGDHVEPCSDPERPFQGRLSATPTTTNATTTSSYPNVELARLRGDSDLAQTHGHRQDSPPVSYIRRSMDDPEMDSPAAKMSRLSPHLFLPHLATRQPQPHQSIHYGHEHRHHQQHPTHHQDGSHHPHHHHHPLQRYNHPCGPESNGEFGTRVNASISTPPSPATSVPSEAPDATQNQWLQSKGPIPNLLHLQTLQRFGTPATEMNHGWPGLLSRADGQLPSTNSSDLALGPLVSMYGSMNNLPTPAPPPDSTYVPPFAPNFENWRPGVTGESISSLFNGNTPYMHPAPVAEPFYQRLCGIPNTLNLFNHCGDADKYPGRILPIPGQTDRAKDVVQSSPRSNTSPGHILKGCGLNSVAGDTDGLLSGIVHSSFTLRPPSPNWTESLSEERRLTDVYDPVPLDTLTANNMTTASPLHSSNSSSTPAFGFSTSPKPAGSHESQVDETNVWTDSRQPTVCNTYYSQRPSETLLLPTNFSSVCPTSFLTNNADMQFSLSSS